MLALAATSFLSASADFVDVIDFTNLGFQGYYYDVKAFKDVTKDSCTCERGDAVSFKGPNAPLNEALSVHFRGPLVLNEFAYYTTDLFTLGLSSSSSWNRLTYYNAEKQVGENITFLTTAGEYSPCLGYALTFAGANGTSAAKKATLLESNNKIYSNEEYAIFSNVSCDSSGPNNDCGVYRSGIPAFQGFAGTVKMFLFDFEMPTEDKLSSDVSNYDMPAIWLLNAKIPRTAQYSNNVNCSCWRSGCGEFDVFEIMNTTEALNLYSTVHDYQGTGDIQNGIAADKFIERDLTGNMKGGVVFDLNGNAAVFVSNSTRFDSTISGSDINSWISKASADGGSVSTALSSATNPLPSSTSKKSGGANVTPSIFTNFVVGVLGLVYGLF